ncbi:SANT/Myb_domain [Hexamita inflata]|uniref:SANT/Myb domain n=1 Tax=Hexamita inflata TaxID=28002 RepID=A0AA86UYG1_9EUKA|nr:SANT/Myb domain [Hexamita inflata]
MRWSDEEKVLFEQLFKSYEIAFAYYVQYFQNRTESQIKSFYYNVVYSNKQIAAKNNSGIPQTKRYRRSTKPRIEQHYNMLNSSIKSLSSSSDYSQTQSIANQKNIGISYESQEHLLYIFDELE